METFYQILGLAGAILIVWILYRSIKNNKDAFSKDKMSKSFYSMGILGVILIAFVAFLIFMLRAT